MQYLPAAFSKILSKKQQQRSVLPQSGTPSNLFDDLPESEKQAALAKLYDLAAEQPGQTSTKKSRRCFSWKVFAIMVTILSLAVMAIVGLVYAVDSKTSVELASKLRMANTNAERLALLPKDEDWLFDFTKQEKYTFSPGGVVNANAASFPATIGQGMTMAMLNLGPCSILPPHIHPRAVNYVVSVTGETRTFMINENGARMVEETLTPGKMTIFPQASVHTMMNVGCDNAQLISALSSDDAGTMNLATAFFNLPANFTSAVLGPNADYTALGASVPAVGTGSNFGPEQCIAACKAKGKMIKRSF